MIRALGVDLVAARQRRAPAIVIERAGEMMGVRRAVALGAIMRVVEMQLRFVAAETAILRAVYRQVVVDPGQDGFPVSALEKGRRQGSAGRSAGA